MIGLLCFVLAVPASPFKSKLRLEAENAVLRHQLNVVRRRLNGRVRLTNHDRWFLIQLYRWFPSILQVLTIIRPETLERWHRAGFRCYWRWKSLPLGGRPQIDTELRVSREACNAQARFQPNQIEEDSLRKGTFFSFLQSFCRCREKRLAGAAPEIPRDRPSSGMLSAGIRLICRPRRK
jgi:hypothetical protein